MQKLQTGFHRGQLLTAICELANDIQKRIHPYSRKKFKPHTITIGDIFNLGALLKKSIITNKDLEILHKDYSFLVSKNALKTKIDKAFPTWNIEQWFLKLEARLYIK